MKNKETIKKLRECAKGLLEVTRELQSSERMEPPGALEIVERQIKAKLPHVLIGGATGQG